jgi:hypothetical protein
VEYLSLHVHLCLACESETYVERRSLGGWDVGTWKGEQRRRTGSSKDLGEFWAVRTSTTLEEDFVEGRFISEFELRP